MMKGAGLGRKMRNSIVEHEFGLFIRHPGDVVQKQCKHAEDIFGELFNEANNFYIRANSLQDRIDCLAVKVTQLDSTVKEVSLQDINMKKAFKSFTVQDQQVVSKNSIPNPVADIYNQSDKTPPLNILIPYRYGFPHPQNDKKDGLKFYTDPSYFFDLWKEKMLQDTEDKRKEKRRQKVNNPTVGMLHITMDLGFLFRKMLYSRHYPFRLFAAHARGRDLGLQRWHAPRTGRWGAPPDRRPVGCKVPCGSRPAPATRTPRACRSPGASGLLHSARLCTSAAGIRPPMLPRARRLGGEENGVARTEKHKLTPNRNQQVHVRKVRTRKEESERRKIGIEFMSDTRKLEQEGSTKEDRMPRGSHASDVADYSYPATPNHSLHPQLVTPSCIASDAPPHGAPNQAPEHKYRPPSASVRHMALDRPQQLPPPPQNPEGSQASASMTPADYGMLPAQIIEYYNSSGPPPPPPPPMIPSAQTAFVSPLQIPMQPPFPASAGSTYAAPPHPSSAELLFTAPPPPGPPPPPPGPPGPRSSLSSSPMHGPPVAEAKHPEPAQPLISDARSDLLAAIRIGIQLKKVQQQPEQEAEQEPVGNDVTTILSRLIAVEYSDSNDDSEFDENDWSD
ncbi:actin-binding protein WASF3-like [Callospermophilus lateralis]|uniref:actin-binding protein WASF3-like n=1 Tax=Callospermophilus lateralis TaxID=76772 RepID=UPI004038BF4A